MRATSYHSWSKPENWYAQYFGTYGLSAVQTFGGAFLTALALGQTPQQAFGAATTAVNSSSNDLNVLARNAADQGRYLPGTPEFEAAKQKVINGYIGQPTAELPRGGSKFLDKTNLYHMEGMYNFSNQIKFAEIIVGATFTDGTEVVRSQVAPNPITKIRRSLAHRSVERSCSGSPDCLT